MVTENRYFQLARRLKYRYISFKILLWIILTAKMSSFLLIPWVIMYVKSPGGFLRSYKKLTAIDQVGHPMLQLVTSITKTAKYSVLSVSTSVLQAGYC